MKELMKGDLNDENGQRQLDQKYEALNCVAGELCEVNEKYIQMLNNEDDIPKESSQ